MAKGALLGKELCDWTAGISWEQEELAETGGGGRRSGGRPGVCEINVFAVPCVVLSENGGGWGEH